MIVFRCYEEVKPAPKKPSAVRRFLARIRLWLRERGFFVSHLTDDDLASIISRSVRAGMRKRKKKTDRSDRSDGERVRFAAGDQFEVIKNALPKEFVIYRKYQRLRYLGVWAQVKTVTENAPAFFNTFAAASSVAPVVYTSSIRSSLIPSSVTPLFIR